MQETTTVFYDFWQFLYFATIFIAACSYFTYRYAYSKGWEDGYSMLFSRLVEDGVIEVIEDDEPDEDIY